MKKKPKGTPPLACIKLASGALLMPRLEQDKDGNWKIANAASLRELMAGGKTPKKEK